MTSLYKFSHNTFRNKQFTWAQSIIPHSPLVILDCPKCSARGCYPSAEFDVILEEGQAYPDLLGCGAFPFLIVSTPAVQAFHEAGINSFHTYPVGIKEIRNSLLSIVDSPGYFRVDIKGYIKVDLAASGAKIVSHCKRCNTVRTEPMVIPKYSMVPGSWDGSPLIRDHELFPFVNFCSQEVVDMVRKKKLTNFRFRLMDEI